MLLSKHIIRSSPVVLSPRVSQVLGMFDVPPLGESTQQWDVSLDLPAQWNIGVIVGPSGCGKSTVAAELFGDCIATPPPWPDDRSILDGFPPQLGVRDVVGLLSSVGFSSPPAWVRPFAVLSNGQQFRVNLAHALASAMVDHRPTLVDEYSSVVDRTVAQIGSAAVAKTVRRHGLQLIAVTCHYDVLDWLEPDWAYEPHTNALRLNAAAGDDRGGLWRRPRVQLEIFPTAAATWRLFKHHHYLSAALNHSAACYAATVNGDAAAFAAVLPFPHPTRPGWREHRTVCLPDFQGIGIGNAMSEFVASLYRATGKPYTSTTSHPAMIRHRARSPLWRMARRPGLGAARRRGPLGRTAAIDRITAGFEYIGPARAAEARRFGLNVRSTFAISNTRRS
jgi:GNAT superfamily N-acetyltransferase